MTSQWTPEAIRALGATTDLPTLGSIFGNSFGAQANQQQQQTPQPATQPAPPASWVSAPVEGLRRKLTTVLLPTEVA